MSEKKDWVGGRASVFKTLGASNHTDHERAWGDYYATEPKATEWLLKLEQLKNQNLMVEKELLIVMNTSVVRKVKRPERNRKE